MLPHTACTCMHTPVITHKHTHTTTHSLYLHAYTLTLLHMHIDMHVHTAIHSTYLITCTLITCTHTHVHCHIQHTPARYHIHAQTCTHHHIYSTPLHAHSPLLYIHTHTYCHTHHTPACTLVVIHTHRHGDFWVLFNPLTTGLGQHLATVNTQQRPGDAQLPVWDHMLGVPAHLFPPVPAPPMPIQEGEPSGNLLASGPYLASVHVSLHTHGW